MTAIGSTPPLLKVGDDLRHRPTAGGKGRDSLYFNVMLPDLELGVFVYTWADHHGRAGRLVTAWGRDPEPLAFEVVHGVAMGDADFDDWHIDGLDLHLPDPLRTAEIRYRGENLQLDYDFTGTHSAFDYGRNAGGCPQWMAINRFEQTGWARGELRLGTERIAFDQPAHRDHSWGRRDWKMPQHWKWVVAQTPSGRGLNLFQWIARGETGTNGYVLRDGQPIALVDARCETTYDADMTNRSLHAVLTDEAGGVTELDLERYGTVALPVGSDTVLNEAACWGRIDGEVGWGQFEAQWPASYVEHLTEPCT